MLFYHLKIFNPSFYKKKNMCQLLFWNIKWVLKPPTRSLTKIRSQPHILVDEKERESTTPDSNNHKKASKTEDQIEENSQRTWYQHATTITEN